MSKTLPPRPARFLTALAVVFLATTAVLPAKQIEGVDVPASRTVEGKNLKLNGAGVRVVKLMLIPIKAYVAAFYAPGPVKSLADASTLRPLEFDFTFLHGVGQGDVTKAWNAQFDASVSESYAGLAKDQAAFVKMFGPLQSGGVETVVLTDKETKVYDNGTLKGSIPGADFQKAFLSMWFGSKPVMPSLKSDLLGQ
jgi:hypothetical protein